MIIQQKDTDISDNKNGTGFGYCVDMNHDGTIIGIGTICTNQYTYDYFTWLQEQQRKHIGKICVYKNEENKWLRHGGELKVIIVQVAHISNYNSSSPPPSSNNYWGFAYFYGYHI